MFVILLEDIGLNINGIEYDGRFFNVVFWFMKMVLLGGVFKLVSSIVCLIGILFVLGGVWICYFC